MRREIEVDQEVEDERKSATTKERETENNGDTRVKEREEKVKVARDLEGHVGSVEGTLPERMPTGRCRQKQLANHYSVELMEALTIPRTKPCTMECMVSQERRKERRRKGTEGKQGQGEGLWRQRAHQ